MQELRSEDDGVTDERGMVTAELAVGILAACLISIALAWCVSLVGAQIRCSDSAAAIARQYARDDLVGAQIASGSAPEGAEVTVSRDGQLVEVSVTVERSFVGFSTLVTGKAQMIPEPGN